MKVKFFSFALSLDFVFLAVTIYNNTYNPYNPYNQVSPYNQSYYHTMDATPPGNTTEEEKAITAKIEASFQADPLLSKYASQIQVSTAGQEVSLSGLVDSDRVRLSAESKAKNTLGVKKVNNLINVEKTK